MDGDLFPNAFGHFTRDGRAFVVTDSNAPTPWVNIVCNGRYGLIVSHNGGGFSWLDNSQLNVLTRWEMDLARDDHGRFIYLSDLDSGELWSLSPAPCHTKFDSYRCEHTQGSSTFTTEFAGVRAAWTLSVAPDDNAEVWTVELTNLRKSARRLRIASWFEWCLGVAPDAKREFHRLFITTRYDDRRHAVVATKNMWDLPPRNEKEHWNRPWPYVAAHACAGITFDNSLATASKEHFLGRYGDPHAPLAMTQKQPVKEAFGRFHDAACALGGDLTLAAGATVKLHFVTAIAEDESRLMALLDTYRNTARAWATPEASRHAWQQRLAPANVETNEPSFDLMNNHWLPYQAICGRLWARTGYYQQSGAYGFRDQLQDSQVWLPLDPDGTRKQIMLHAAHQFSDGSVYHWWHPLAEFGLRTKCSDDYLWLPFVTANYIRETGDMSILDAAAPFVDEPAANATILDHCLRAFRKSFGRFSERGLPHIGSCDWNDGLSAMGVDEKGETVWLAFFLVQILGDFAHLLDQVEDRRTAQEFREKREKLVQAINAHAWDGAWYKGATMDSGRWLGSKDNAPGPAQVFLNCQTWAIMTNAGPEDRLSSAWNTVRTKLLGEMGPLLIWPAYTQPEADVGYITRYSPGSRENGGVYMHAATWALAAAALRRDAEAVGKIWKSISPPLRAGGQHAERYRAEPYVTPGNVDGPLSDTPGKAGWTWYTGSAAWLNRVCLEYILGVRPVWDGVMIDPVPFVEMGKVTARRVWRGRVLKLTFDSAEFAPPSEGGTAACITVNGKTILGNVLREEDLSTTGDNEVSVGWGMLTTRPQGAAAIAGRERSRT
ncbi:MAG: GH36-type glycosyl hydrolase domain-containing protein [Phycisphaerales bacterium]